jgi:glycerol-3-phosphate dehydrogenase (NAD(P)+)
MIQEGPRVAVIGSGCWATALMKILLNNTCNVSWFVRNPETIDFIRANGSNPRYLSSVRFQADRISFFSDINEIVAQNDVLILAVPSAFLRDVFAPLTGSLEGKFVLSAIKGIIPGDNMTVTEYFHRTFGVPQDNLGVISGPCHAEEIALERLSYLTVVSKHRQDGETISRLLSCRYVRTIFSDDIYGVEYAGVLKNIYSLAAGICHGLGYGDNFQAVLLANAFREMKLFIDKTKPHEREQSNSVYLGDLLVTGYSQFSRNRMFGTMIGKGYSTLSARTEMNMVAEGYYASACLHEINKRHAIEMPIAEAVYNILYDSVAPWIEMRLLSDKMQ